MNKLIIWTVIIIAVLATGTYLLKNYNPDVQPAASSGERVIPLELIEDSRCPIDVQCIWAGTVKVKARVETSNGSKESIFELSKPEVVDGWQITLSEVKPAPYSERQIAFEDYDFDFIITQASN